MAGTPPGGANGRALQSRKGLGSSPAWSSSYSDSLGNELSSLTPYLPSLAQRGAQSWQEVNTQEISEKQMGSSSMSTINVSNRPAQYFEFLDCKKKGKKPGRREVGYQLPLIFTATMLPGQGRLPLPKRIHLLSTSRTQTP